MVGAAMSAIGWLVLLPPSWFRRRPLSGATAIATDIVLLSASLHAGNLKVWFPLSVRRDQRRLSPRPIGCCGVVECGWFAAVFASTPFWRDPALASARSHRSW
jgi:hypothetical protein